MREAATLNDVQAERVGNGGDFARRVLFVCTGNTCRSPMAAALLNHLCAPREICSACPDDPMSGAYTATSAGLYATEGDPITPAAARALREAGVVSSSANPYEAHRAHRVNEDDVANADIVMAISAAHAMELMLRFPDAASKIRTLPMDIPDPFGGSDEVYRTCLSQLRYCLHIAFFVGEQAP